MMSKGTSARNRVSPILVKENGHLNHRNGGVNSPTSSSGVHLDVKKNGSSKHKPSSSGQNLTKLIRKRRYDKYDEKRADQLMLKRNEDKLKKWTASLTERRK